MRAWTSFAVGCLLLAGAPAALAHDKHDEEDGKPAERGSFELDVRWRWENVEDDLFPENARAGTLRTRLGWHTPRRSGWHGYVELEDIREAGADRYNDTRNMDLTRPVIADPEETELNRAWVAVEPTDVLALKFGRQRIFRDGGRLIGNVGWRQNEQTFDAATLSAGRGRWTAWGGYLTRANRIFGDDHPNLVLRQFDLDAIVAEGSYDTGWGVLAATAHWLEFENSPATSHRNLGLRWSGTHAVGEEWKLLHRLEWVDQSSHADAPDTNDADYLVASLGFVRSGWKVSANLEALSGDGTYGFQRPLATLHAFNGWADLFLSTPAAGLEDLFLLVEKKFGKWTAGARYHRFRSDAGSVDYGDEIDAMLKRPLWGKRCEVLLKGAAFSADDGSRDVTKIWAQVSWRP